MQKNRIKENNGISYIFKKGLFLILIGLLFDFMAAPALLIKSDFWAVVFALFILLPFLYIVFISGRMSGEHCYKAIKRNKLMAQQAQPVTKAQKFLEYHWAKGLLFCSLYPIWQIIFLILGLLLKNAVLCGIVNLYNMSFMGILSIAGLYKTGADLYDLFFLIIILIVPAVFETGYILGGEKLKKQHQEIEMELKLFNS